MQPLFFVFFLSVLTLHSCNTWWSIKLNSAARGVGEFQLQCCLHTCDWLVRWRLCTWYHGTVHRNKRWNDGMQTENYRFTKLRFQRPLHWNAIHNGRGSSTESENSGAMWCYFKITSNSRWLSTISGIQQICISEWYVHAHTRQHLPNYIRFSECVGIVHSTCQGQVIEVT